SKQIGIFGHGVLRRRMHHTLSIRIAPGQAGGLSGVHVAEPLGLQPPGAAGGRSTAVSARAGFGAAAVPSLGFPVGPAAIGSQPLTVRLPPARAGATGGENAAALAAGMNPPGLRRVGSTHTTLSHLLNGSSSVAGTSVAGTSVAGSMAGSEALQTPTILDGGSVASGSIASATSTVLNAMRQRFVIPPDTSLWQRFCYRALHFIASGTFGLVMLVLIVMNTVMLSLDSYPSDEALSARSEVINFVLTVIFAAEMLFKLIVMGRVRYFRDKFNRFDVLIVLLSVVDLAIAPPSFITHVVVRSSGVLALRTLRLSRIFKLARSWTSLRVLLRTLKDAINDVAYFAILLVLYMFIFSLFGMQIFANRFRFDPYTLEALHPSDARYWAPDVHIPRSSFDNLFASYLTLFQIMTTENWNDVLTSAYLSTGAGGVAFIVCTCVIGNMVMLSLFLAIILGAFEGLDDPAAEAAKKALAEAAKSDVADVAAATAAAAAAASEAGSESASQGGENRSRSSGRSGASRTPRSRAGSHGGGSSVAGSGSTPGSAFVARSLGAAGQSAHSLGVGRNKPLASDTVMTQGSFRHVPSQHSMHSAANGSHVSGGIGARSGTSTAI
ncbi:ion transporter, partial [archaeon]